MKQRHNQFDNETNQPELLSPTVHPKKGGPWTVGTQTVWPNLFGVDSSALGLFCIWNNVIVTFHALFFILDGFFDTFDWLIE